MMFVVNCFSVVFAVVVLYAWLIDGLVWLIIRVSLGVLVGFGDVVSEWGKIWAVSAVCLWPVPSVWHWLHVFEDGPALINEGGGIGVLMAHLDDDSTVDVLLIFEIIIGVFEVVESPGGLFEVCSVVFDLLLVVVDVASVLRNVGGILVAEGLSVLNSVLEVGSGESESFSGNEHVGGLSNLELVVLSTEKLVSHVVLLDLVTEVGEGQVHT